MGPILIFDKSALESLNPDEACWLENFFMSNITPLFFIEILADLEKQIKSGRTPEQVVGNLAYKTPVLSSKPNVHHLTLVSGELMGHEVPMKYRQILISGGIPVTTGNKKGVYFKPSPEEEAFERWQRGEFLDLERQTARAWRAQLSNLDLEGSYKLFQRLFEGKLKPKSLMDAKRFVDDLMNDPSRKDVFLKSALDLLGVPPQSQQLVLQRWDTQERPLLKDFAPYTAHIFSVDMFFYTSIAADLVSRGRPSNRIDIAYLYYLPFCMVFTSGDRLHAKTVPLFLEEDQSFVVASDLKKDLQRLDRYYSKLPDEVKVQGIMRFAARPPEDSSFLVSRLWDKHMSKDWRNLSEGGPEGIGKKTQSKILEMMQRFKESAQAVDSSDRIDSEEADHILIERHVPTRRGKWRLLPPEVEKTQDD